MTAAAIALAAHALLLLLLVLGIQVTHPAKDAPPIEVSLIRLFTPRPKPPPRPSPTRAPAKAQQAAAPVARPTPAPVAPAPPLPETGSIDPRLAAAEAVRNALQATVRCAHPDAYDMTSVERDACARHLHDLREGAPEFAIGPHLPPLVASHGTKVVSHLSPRPGTDLGPLDLGPVRGVSH